MRVFFAAFPPEIAEFAKSKQHDPHSAEQRYKTQRAPEYGVARRRVSHHGFIWKVGRVGVRRARALSDGGPGGPCKERCKLAQFLRVLNEPGRKPGTRRGLLEVIRPLFGLVLVGSGF